MSENTSNFSDAAFEEVDNMFGLEDEATKIIKEDDFSESNPDFYRPSISHKNAKNKTYSARGRFVPNPHDPANHIVRKFIYYLPDPEFEDRNMYIDCLSNEKGKKSNIISEAYFHMYKHEYATFQQIAKKFFQRKTYWWQLFYIMIDEQDTDVEGKIKIFRYGTAIHDKIVSQATENPSLGKKATTVYHPFKGKDLLLHIGEKNYDDKSGGKTTKGVTYEQSEFDGDVTTFSLDQGQTRMPMTKEAAQQVQQFIKENSPDMSQIYYNPWDTETEDKAIMAVRNLIQDEKTFDLVMKKAYKSGAVERAHIAMEHISAASDKNTGTVSSEMKVDTEGAQNESYTEESASFTEGAKSAGEDSKSTGENAQNGTTQQSKENAGASAANEIDNEVDNLKAGLKSKEPVEAEKTGATEPESTKEVEKTGATEPKEVEKTTEPTGAISESDKVEKSEGVATEAKEKEAVEEDDALEDIKFEEMSDD